MNKNQNNQLRQGQRGGKRAGAGRPKGTVKRPQIHDYITDADIKKLVATAKKNAQAGDTTSLKLLIEQVFGRAPQSMDLSTLGEKLEGINVTIVNGDKPTSH